jgi:hypothetical protein
MKYICGLAKRPSKPHVKTLEKKGDAERLGVLRKMLADLMKRCTESSVRYTTILHRGGGNLGAIEKAHLPFLSYHLGLLDEAIGRVEARRSAVAT